MRKLLLLFVFIILLCGTAESNHEYFPARVKNLSNKEYFPFVYNAIKSARESIFIVMYLINMESPDAPALKLIEELISARKRGLDIRVILDCKRGLGIKNPNYPAYKLLKENDINVNLDNINIYTHNKLIIIDREITIVGSSNWSTAALCENNETNVAVYSPLLAKELTEEMNNIKLSENLPVEGISVNIPCKFIFDKKIFSAMSKAEDERSLDIYLILLKENGGDTETPISLTYENLAKQLKSRIKMDMPSWRRQINRTLKKLANRYNLITLNLKFNKPFTVNLTNLGKDTFGLPYTYWEYGWDRLLLMREKVCLLINLSELNMQNNINEWSASAFKISKKYGMSKWVFQRGTMGLRRYNILEAHPSATADYKKRKPNTYKYKGLYDIKQFHINLVSLGKIYGTKKIVLARHLAFIVWRGFDIEAVEDIARFMDIYGEDIVKEAFSIISRKCPDNPKRNLAYCIGIMKKLSQRPKPQL